MKRFSSIKKISLVIILGIVAYSLYIGVWAVILTTPSVTFDSGITAQSIKQIQIGMTGEQVIQLLGVPKNTDIASSTLTYERLTPWHTNASSLYIHMDKGKVNMIYGKQQSLFGVNDWGIYMKDKNGIKMEKPSFFKAFPENR